MTRLDQITFTELTKRLAVAMENLDGMKHTAFGIRQAQRRNAADLLVLDEQIKKQKDVLSALSAEIVHRVDTQQGTTR